MITETNQDDVFQYCIEKEEHKGDVLDILIALATEKGEESHEESR